MRESTGRERHLTGGRRALRLVHDSSKRSFNNEAARVAAGHQPAGLVAKNKEVVRRLLRLLGIATELESATFYLGVISHTSNNRSVRRLALNALCVAWGEGAEKAAWEWLGKAIKGDIDEANRRYAADCRLYIIHRQLHKAEHGTLMPCEKCTDAWKVIEAEWQKRIRCP